MKSQHTLDDRKAIFVPENSHFLTITVYKYNYIQTVSPLLCKVLWVSSKALYKCNELLLYHSVVILDGNSNNEWFNIMGIIGFSVFSNNESASVKELILGPNCNFGANTKTEITSKNKHRWSHNVPVIPSQNLSRITFISNFKLDMFMLIMIRIIRRYFFFKEHEFLWKPNAMLQSSGWLPEHWSMVTYWFLSQH